VPFPKPETVHEVVEVAHCNDPGEDVTVYVVMAEPPSVMGTDQVSDAVPSPGEALTDVGAPGTVRGVAVIEPDAVPGATAFTARTRTG